jgi:DNA-binding MarR family transcriptional regulator
MSRPAAPEPDARPIGERVAAGLSRIGVALKARAWKGAGPEGVTPTQAQALAVIAGARAGARLDRVARELGVSAPTASDAVAALVAKGLARRERAAADARAVALTATDAGAALAARIADWPDFLVRAVDALDESEAVVFLRGLVKIIRTLQEQGAIAPQRICVSCAYFRPYVHADAARPHHCAFVDAAFGEAALRLDCADQRPAPAAEAATIWTRWSGAPPAPANVEGGAS